MNTRSRTVNTLINIFASVGAQILTLILSFITRTIFIQQLGVEYLGVNGLYTNILTVLSLADLGIGTAMAYTLYKPIANKDYSLLTSLINYFKKIYRFLAFVVLALGICLLPFLKYIVNVDIDIERLQLYYLLFLANTVFSYLIIYKTTIIKADQRFYIIKIYNLLFDILKNILQITLLIFTQSFIAYLFIQLISTLINNLFISNKVDKLYPFIKDKAQSIDNKTKRTIFSHVKAMFIYRFGGVILNSTDNIIISVLIGTTWVGYYSNYHLIIGAVITICGLFFSSFVNSVGNLNATNPHGSEPIFKAINFLNFWVYGFSSIAIFTLIDDFIFLWLGKEYILNKAIILAIVLNVYIPGMLQGVTNFRDTTELFLKTKYVFLITALLNLIFSIILGIKFGLFGILLATAIARLLTNFWYEPFMLYKIVFRKKSLTFFLKQLVYAVIVIIVILFLEFVLPGIFQEITLLSFVLKTILVVIITNLIFYLVFNRTSEFIFLKKRITQVFISYVNKR